MGENWKSLLAKFSSEEWGTVASTPTAVPGDHVYVLVVEWKVSSMPLYVGQTTLLSRRIGDYVGASFQAPTDFKVGEAIKYLTGLAYKIHCYYHALSAPRKDEKALIRDLLLEGCILLNFLGGYAYKTASKTDEQKIIHLFCDMIVSRCEVSTTS